MSGVQIALTLDKPPLKAELELPGRGITCLTGDGAARLLRAVAGLERCSGGVYLGKERFAGPAWRRPVALVFSEPRLFPHLSVAANLRWGVGRRPAAMTEEAVIARLGLESLMGRRPSELALAEATRVSVGRALLSGARLLLMEEPILPPAERDALLHALAGLAVEVPVLLACTDAGTAARMGTEVVCLHNGEAVGGPVNELMVRTDLPLCRDAGAATRIAGIVSGHDTAGGLSFVDCRGGRFCVPLLPVRSGKPATVSVAAGDVWLSGKPPVGASSALSVLPVVVETVAEDGAERVVVLAGPDVKLLSRLSAAAVAGLKLKPGSKAYAQIRRVHRAYG